MSAVTVEKMFAYREAIESELMEHPAVQVWLQMDPKYTIPKRIENIRLWSSPKPFICRMLGAGKDGFPVIAKRCKAPAGKIERRIYEDILPRLSLPKLEYYGSFPEGDDFLWIFLEDAGGRQFSFHKPGDRRIAVQWLADLHTSSSYMGKPENLIERDPAYYFKRLTGAQEKFYAHLNDDVFCKTDRKVMAASLDQIGFCAASWEKVRALYYQLPRCMVHGDFKSKNIHLRGAAHAASVAVFDWEYAGWGSPGIDMWRLDEAEYRNAVSRRWPHCGADTVHQLKHLGKLFRAIDSYFWEVSGLEHTQHAHIRQKLIESLPEYDFYIADAMRGLKIW